jgi:hypothetical protein
MYFWASSRPWLGSRPAGTVFLKAEHKNGPGSAPRGRSVSSS